MLLAQGWRTVPWPRQPQRRRAAGIAAAAATGDTRRSRRSRASPRRRSARRRCGRRSPFCRQPFLGRRGSPPGLGASGGGSVGAVGPLMGAEAARCLLGGLCAEISRLLAMSKAPKRGAASLVDPSPASTLGRLSAPDHRTQPCGSCPRERNGFRGCFLTFADRGGSSHRRDVYSNTKPPYPRSQPGESKSSKPASVLSAKTTNANLTKAVNAAQAPKTGYATTATNQCGRAPPDKCSAAAYSRGAALPGTRTIIA